MDERQAYTKGHPPACTCVDCSRRRLERQQRKGPLQRLFDKLRGKR